MTTTEHLRDKDISVPATDYLEIGLNLAAKLPEHASAAAEPKLDRILTGMADYLWHNEDLRDASNPRVPLSHQQIYEMLVNALDAAR